jgi:peptidoglycan biosynthesis protein MviN/MurJ (putative lipid II flippase)
MVLTLLGEAGANFVLSVLLCRPLGIQGVAVGTLLPAVCITLAVLPAYLVRRLGVSAAQFVRQVIGPVVVVALLAGLVQQGLSALLPVTSYAVLILRGALSLGGTLAGVMLTFPAQETEELSRLVRRFLRRPVWS